MDSSSNQTVRFAKAYRAEQVRSRRSSRLARAERRGRTR